MIAIAERKTVSVRGAWWTLAVLVVGCVLSMAQPSAAQSFLVPDPVTSSELMEYADIMGLSRQQKLQMLPVHDRYTQQYLSFIEDDLTVLRERLIGLARRMFVMSSEGTFSIPPREELEELIDEYDRAFKKCIDMDRSLFQQMQPLVADQQQLAVERAGRLRQLDLYQQMLQMFVRNMNRGAAVNLSDEVRELTLTVEEQRLVDPIITSYEKSLLREARDTEKILRELATGILDAIDELGLREMTLEDMMQLDQDDDFIGRVRGIFDDISRPFQEKAYEISQLNMKTYQRLAAVLSEDNARKLRNWFYRRAYSRVYDGPPQWLVKYDESLLRSDLAADTKTQIEQQRVVFLRRDDQLVDSIVADVEATRKYRTSAQFEEGSLSGIRDKVDTYRDRRESLAKEAESALASLTVKEVVADAEAGGKSQVSEEQTTTVGAEQAVEQPQEQISEAEQERRNRQSVAERVMPEPMSAENLRQLADVLGWDESNRALLLSLHEDYSETYEKTKTRPIESAEENAEKPSPTAQVRSIKQRFDELQQVDEAFFDDVLLLVSSPQREDVERWRSARQRAAAHAAANSLASTGFDQEESVDLVELVMTSHPQLLQEREVAELLDAYDMRLTDLATERVERAGQVYRHSVTMQEIQWGGNQDPAQQQLHQRIMQNWQEAREHFGRLDQQISKLNRQTLQSLVATVSDDRETVWQLQYAYNREAYPDIYNAADRPRQLLDAAANLSDLDSRQQQAIDEIRHEFNDAFFEVSERMVELRREVGEDGFLGGGMPSNSQIDRFIELERLEFVRSEAGERARIKVELLLNDQQQEALNALVDSDDDAQKSISFN